MVGSNVPRIMARPTLSVIDRWTSAVHYGDKPPFAYLREKLPDFDGEKRFSVYTAHAKVSDRLWCGWFVTKQQAVLWIEWNAVDLMATTGAVPENARSLAKALADKPNGFIKRHTSGPAVR